MSPAMETVDLTRRFGDRVAVDAVSLCVPERAVYGFLGRNGAGKTTTLKMLLGLLKPTSGSARILGVDVGRDRIAAAANVGALFEAHGFYGHMSGRQNLDLARRLLGLAPGAVDRALEVVEMTADAGRRVADYSLGMRQRLGLARALLGEPPVLILDEPTNGLDPDGIADMRRFLRTLPERAGATVLVSSHLLGEIEQTATHVGILENGRLALQGELAALKAGMAPEIQVETGDPARARAVLAGLCLAVEAAPEALIARLKPGEDPRAAAADLARALVAAGVPVFSLSPRARTLEGLYRDITRGQPRPEAA